MHDGCAQILAEKRGKHDDHHDQHGDTEIEGLRVRLTKWLVRQDRQDERNPQEEVEAT